MSKLAQKFLISLSVILILVIISSIYLNSHFIERYYLYLEKQDLKRFCNELTATNTLDKNISQLEHKKDILIIQVENTENNDLLNARLWEALREKGLGFEKFWLWEQDQKTIEQVGHKLKLYEQEKLHYSLLIEYFTSDAQFFAAVKIIPAMQRTITLINIVTTCVFTAATFVIFLLIFFLMKKITTPLNAIGRTARSIASLNFCTVDIKSGDELETLAEDINNMSYNLQTAHRELETKNLQMKSLLANVSHDLKTPVSLIKAYANGIKDGIDDGTFLDTIIIQNEKMEQMIERLLDLAKIQNQEHSTESVNISMLLQDVVLEYQFQAQNKGLFFKCEIEPSIIQIANLEAVQTIFSNLVSNAVKYAVGQQIILTLKIKDETCLFEIQNEVNVTTYIEPNRLWEPFYVAEESRNKNISGTGLGLSIVQAVAQKYGYSCACKLVDKKILFTITF